ncbi:MAG: hypothetical protein V1861_02535, partial [Candidatus Micrarchaeota archaeon]
MKSACLSECEGSGSGGGGTGGTGGSGTGGSSSGGSADPCADKHCDKDICQIEAGKGVWYSGGTCVNGECQYNRLECNAGCNTDGDGCAAEVKVDVFLMEPYDNQRIDNQGGPAAVDVIGIARGASEAGVSDIMVSVPGVLMPVRVSMDGDRFSGTVNLPGPGDYEVKVEARGSDGSILSSAVSNVQVGAAFSQMGYWSDSVRVMRDGKEIPITSKEMLLQEGDEVTVLGTDRGWIEYSDGTMAYLNEGVTLRKGKDSSYTILLGNVEVSGNFAHSFDTRFG